MISTFEVFALNWNEVDFFQNLKIISDIESSKNIVESPTARHSPEHENELFDEYFEDWKVLEEAFDQVKGVFNDWEHMVITNLYNVNYKVLLAAAQSFKDTNDKDDFVHTVKLIIKQIDQ